MPDQASTTLTSTEDVKPATPSSDKTIPIQAETPKATESSPDASKPDAEKERKTA